MSECLDSLYVCRLFSCQRFFIMETDYNIHILESSERLIRFAIHQANQNLSFREVFQKWQEEEAFIHFYQKSLLQFGFEAFFWEHPALTTELLEKDYECAVRKSKSLQKRMQDEAPFKEYLDQPQNYVEIPNRKKDSLLIIPTHLGDTVNHTHFGKFIQTVPAPQLVQLFQKIGFLALERIHTETPLWLSTAGLGVSWLHIRFDQRPKYYKVQAFKKADYLYP